TPATSRGCGTKSRIEAISCSLNSSSSTQRRHRLLIKSDKFPITSARYFQISVRDLPSSDQKKFSTARHVEVYPRRKGEVLKNALNSKHKIDIFFDVCFTQYLDFSRRYDWDPAFCVEHRPDGYVTVLQEQSNNLFQQAKVS